MGVNRIFPAIEHRFSRIQNLEISDLINSKPEITRFSSLNPLLWFGNEPLLPTLRFTISEMLTKRHVEGRDETERMEERWKSDCEMIGSRERYNVFNFLPPLGSDFSNLSMIRRWYLYIYSEQKYSFIIFIRIQRILFERARLKIFINLYKWTTKRIDKIRRGYAIV